MLLAKLLPHCSARFGCFDVAGCREQARVGLNFMGWTVSAFIGVGFFSMTRVIVLLSKPDYESN